MPTTPAWEAARNGFPGDLDAVNHATQINQHLGTHQIYPTYRGARAVTPQGGTNFQWLAYGNTTDLAQPVTMSGTTIGRITLPVLTQGDAADLLVSLYPDNGAGAPDPSNQLAAVTVPASWLSQLCASSGLANGGPLATADFNTYYVTGGVITTPLPAPTATGAANIVDQSYATSGDYVITAGGTTSGTPSAIVTTIQYLGSGAITAPVQQPQLPVATANGGLAVTADTLIYAGGNAGPSFTATAAVYAASWNPGTGAVGAWSAQASLPAATSIPSMATSGSAVYSVGGLNSAGAAVSNVWYATVSNGTISGWVAAESYPMPINLPCLGVVGNWLIAAGGYLSDGATPTNAVYYAPINSDGSLGGWITGPSLILPSASGGAPGCGTVVTDSALILFTGDPGTSQTPIQTITATPSGVTTATPHIEWPLPTILPFGAFSNGDGSWAVVGFDTIAATANYTTLTPVPVVSVPLRATGLTNGATYHVVMQQQQCLGADSYIEFGITNGALPASAIHSPRHANSWTTVEAGFSMPITVYDTTAGGPMWHTWEDPAVTGSGYTSNTAARISTFVYANSQDHLIGHADATAMPNDPLNSNPTFTTGISPWAATNGTITQSSAQTRGGYAFSGLLTPAGGTSQAYASSELAPIPASSPGVAQWLTTNGWFYSPTGWPGFSLSVNWFDSGRGYLATSSNTVTLPTATWTNIANAFQAPAGAAYAAIVPTESGTPAAGNLLYMSNVTLTYAPGIVRPLSSVTAVDYNTVGQPVGTTQL